MSNITYVYVDCFTSTLIVTFINNNTHVICRKNTILFDHVDPNNIYIASSEYDKEIIICYKPTQAGTMPITSIIAQCQVISDKIIGYNLSYLNEHKTCEMYVLLGMCNINLAPFGLSNILATYAKFIKTGSHNGIKYNKLKLFRIYCYLTGASELTYENIKHNFDIFVNNNNYFHTEKCLVVSKLIRGYGGNQKTAMQLIELMDTVYDTYVLSTQISKKGKFKYAIDTLHNDIHNSQIIKINHRDGIINHINASQYKLIINNKLHDFFDILPHISSKNYVITHNSMDPFNELIIKNQQYIDTIFTINDKHKQLLQPYITNTTKIRVYTNYVGCEIKVPPKNTFNNKIAFIGRVSREKNIDLLFRAFVHFPQLTLVTIGNCETNQTQNIRCLVNLNAEQIKNELLQCDYLVVPSYTEGIPFVILEAMSIGIPCIYSNINGATEIIDNSKGFLFELNGYDKVKNNISSWEVFDAVDKHIDDNVRNLTMCIKNAYDITINTWNEMSTNCYDFIQTHYTKDVACKQNLLNFNVEY